jgi:hypothetical protein
MRIRKMGRPLPGNSLVEYSLPLTVFFVAGVAIAMVINLPERLQTYLGNTMNAGVAGSSLEVRPMGTMGAGSVKPGALLDPGRYSVVSITLGNGDTLKLDYAGNITSNIETAGVSGTTEKLLAQLDQMTQEMHELGELTPEEESLLKQLSNQGHRIASIEKLIEDAWKNSNSLSEFMAQQIEFDGRTYNPHELSSLLGWTASSYGISMQNGTDEFLTTKNISAVIDGKENISSPSQETSRFIDLYNAVQASGLADKPQAQQVVRALSGQIIIISDTLSDFTYYADHASQGHVFESAEIILNDIETNGYQKDYMDRYNASRATHANSFGICSTGGHQDSGVQCH